jgi:hypothetical protein
LLYALLLLLGYLTLTREIYASIYIEFYDDLTFPIQKRSSIPQSDSTPSKYQMNRVGTIGRMLDLSCAYASTPHRQPAQASQSKENHTQKSATKLVGPST